VLGGEEEPHPCRRLAHRRIEDRLGVDAPLEEHLRDENRPVRAPHDHRDDRRVATGSGIEIAVGGELEEQFRPLPQTGHAPRLAADHFEPLESSRHVRWRAGGGEHERRRGVAEVADQPVAPREVAAAGAERLADRSHPQITVGGIDPEVIADPASLRPHRADGVGLVDIQHRVVATLHLDEPGKIGIVAVHAVDPFDRHDDAAIPGAEIAEEAVELVVIVVAEGPLPRLRGDRPLDDAVVGQFVVQDQVLCAEQVGEDRRIRAVAAGEHRRPLGAEKRGQLGVELVEEDVVASDHAARRGAASEAIDRRLGGPRHIGVAGEAEVVETRETDHVPSGDPGRPPLDAFVGTEEGVREARPAEAAETFLEDTDLGEGIVADGRGRRPLADRAIDDRRLRSGIGIAGIDHVAGDAVDEVTAGVDTIDPLVAEPHPVMPLDPRHGIEERGVVDPGVGERRTVGEASAPPRCLDASELFDDQPGDRCLRARPDERLRSPQRRHADRQPLDALFLRILPCHDLPLPTRADASRPCRPDSLRRHRRGVSHAPPAESATRHASLYRNASVSTSPHGSRSIAATAAPHRKTLSAPERNDPA